MAIARPLTPLETVLNRLVGWRDHLLALLAGMVTALGQAPFDLWWLALLGLAVVYLQCATARGGWQAARRGWLAGIGYFGLALSWIVEPFLVDLARHGWMAPFALLLMAAGLAMFWAAASALAHRMGAGGLAWIAALAAAELLRSYLFTGFPWALLGHLWIATPMAQWAAFGGAHGLGLLALLAAVALGALLRRNYWVVGCAALLLTALWFGGGVLQGPPEVLEGRPVVRLVQPNAPQHQKWDPAHVPTFFRRQIAASAASPRPDLIIWPETAVPVALNDAAETLAVMAGAARGAPLVFGIQRFEGARIYNSAAVLDPDGLVAQVYDKHHLVPFGEYVPFGDRLADFGLHGLATRDGAGFSAGPGPRLLDLGALGTALPLICYEAVFPNDVNAAPSRPDFLLQLTNDAWFGQFSGPHQHLAQARLRAIEQGLPLIRAANTGISAIVDSKGRVIGALPLGEAGHIDLWLPRPRAATFYARIGDFFALFAITGLFLVVLTRNALMQRRFDH